MNITKKLFGFLAIALFSSLAVQKCEAMQIASLGPLEECPTNPPAGQPYQTNYCVARNGFGVCTACKYQ